MFKVNAIIGHIISDVIIHNLNESILNKKVKSFEEDLWPRCKKSLNRRFGRTKFSSYDFGIEFSIYRKRNIYSLITKQFD